MGNQLYIGLETAIAYLLAHDVEDNGVELSDIRRFISKTSKIVNMNLYCNTSDYFIKSTLSLYDSIFKKYQNRIYCKNKFNLDYFNKHYPQFLIKAFNEAVK